MRAGSYEWMRAVRSAPVPGPYRHVAWAIGLRADDQGRCYPSYDTLAADTAQCRRTAITAVKALREAGWLLVVPRSTRHGTTSNCYQLVVPESASGAVDSLGTACGQPVDEPVDKQRGGAPGALGGVHQMHSLGGAPDAPEVPTQEKYPQTGPPQGTLADLVSAIAARTRV